MHARWLPRDFGQTIVEACEDGSFSLAPAPRRPAFIPSIIYADNRAALQWLQKAFAFEPSEVLTDSKDNIVHAQMTHDDGVIMIGSEFASWAKSPKSVGGSNTQRVHVRLTGGIDEHCELTVKCLMGTPPARASAGVSNS